VKKLFSARHREALKEKRLQPTFSRRLRVSVERILNSHSDSGGWNHQENLTYATAESRLKDFYGKHELEAFDENDQRVAGGFSELVQRGYPSELLDAAEAWFDVSPRDACAAEKELNDVFSINASPWRFVNGTALLVDSGYLHSEVVAGTLRLLSETNASGAHEEFMNAIDALQSGENKQAIVEAHKSVESVMKAVLEIDKHITFGGLLAELTKSGLLPEYYGEFMTHFEKLALGAVKERNRPGTGHGQGAVAIEVSRALAQFTLHLAGSINVFLLERWVEKRNASSTKVAASNEITDEDIPF
jgi:hypothetical protein